MGKENKIKGSFGLIIFNDKSLKEILIDIGKKNYTQPYTLLFETDWRLLSDPKQDVFSDLKLGIKIDPRQMNNSEYTDRSGSVFMSAFLPFPEHFDYENVIDNYIGIEAGKGTVRVTRNEDLQSFQQVSYLLDDGLHVYSLGVTRGQKHNPQLSISMGWWMTPTLRLDGKPSPFRYLKQGSISASFNEFVDIVGNIIGGIYVSEGKKNPPSGIKLIGKIPAKEAALILGSHEGIPLPVINCKFCKTKYPEKDIQVTIEEGKLKVNHPKCPKCGADDIEIDYSVVQ